jgi:hypothetical protein
MRAIFAFAIIMTLPNCAGTQATRTSANTMILNTAAAPACGSLGAARVAAKSAAIETIRAGYDRYIITSGSAQNNVAVSQMPGTYNTTGTYGYGGFNATSTYTPGPTIVSGSHDQNLAVVMFRRGDPGYDQALDAREQLGTEWESVVKKGIRTCL